MLSKQKKYGESTEVLKTVLKAAPLDESAKIYLGINNVELKNFVGAIELLEEVIEKNPRSFEGNFHLGRAYTGLKIYDTAKDVFSTAVEINPNNAHARYEYAVCLHQMGERQTVAEEYEILLGMDEELAEKLRREAGIKKPAGE